MNAKIGNTSSSDCNMDDEPMRKPGVGSSRDIVRAQSFILSSNAVLK